jgi:hypothetical protein
VSGGPALRRHLQQRLGAVAGDTLFATLDGLVGLRLRAEGNDRRPATAAATTFSASDLARMEIPPARWVLDGVLAEGLTTLGGKPKIGKSWLVYNLAVAVASGGPILGGVPAQGDVLYLSLEDTKRRLKNRLLKIIGDTPAPMRLTLTCQWPRMHEGGLEALEGWLRQHHEARLVVIDTWPRFKPMRIARVGADNYDLDVADGAALKALADAHGISVLVVTHCRKMAADDPVDELRGTVGTAATSDGVLIMRRERGRPDAVLFVTGRDIEDEREIALRFNKETAVWECLGDAEEFRVSEAREAILDLFRGMNPGTKLAPAAVAELLNKSRGSVRKIMAAMHHDGQLHADLQGRYGLPDEGRSA